MHQIHKHRLSLGKFELHLPASAQLLKAAWQEAAGGAMLWALVDMEAETVPRRFYLIPTGTKIPNSKALRYIDTVLIKGGEIVMHLFEDLVIEDL